MTDPVDVIARAICNASAGSDVWEYENDPETHRWYDFARAVLSALEAKGISLVRIEEKPGLILVYDQDGDQIIAHYT